MLIKFQAEMVPFTGWLHVNTLKVTAVSVVPETLLAQASQPNKFMMIINV